MFIYTQINIKSIRFGRGTAEREDTFNLRVGLQTITGTRNNSARRLGDGDGD